ncbi:MAG: NeuD/PglB/VioB family sugar acetyltransferase [Gemmatimonadota bacterium]|nr:NeuD/PglB/VioB family sugar acetyltransferase [Gemmatimonadota bacterium]
MLHLIGGGGHASVVADVARRGGIGEITLWCNRAPDLAAFPLGTTYRPVEQLDPSLAVCLAFGDLLTRREMRERFPCAPAALVDPSVVIGGNVTIADGAVVMPACVINANARVGADAIINTGTIVEHDCVIGRNAHLSPGVRLAGAARVGHDAHVGTGAIILPGVTVGDGAVVGAGAVVIRDVAPAAVVAGVPAQPLRR